MKSVKNTGVISVNQPRDLGRLDGSDEAGVVVVLVHAPWCPYCQDLRPEWDAFAREMSEMGVAVVEIEMDVLPYARQAHNSMVARLEANSRVQTVPRVAIVRSRDDRDDRGTVEYESSPVSKFPYRSQKDLQRFWNENGRPKSLTTSKSKSIRSAPARARSPAPAPAPNRARARMAPSAKPSSPSTPARARARAPVRISTKAKPSATTRAPARRSSSASPRPRPRK